MAFVSGNYHTLRVILGDQLNASHSWFKAGDDGVLYLIAEFPSEAHYVKHHIQKLCAFFLAMARFAAALNSAGHRVCYLTLDDTQHLGFGEIIEQVFGEAGAIKLEVQRPDEYRVLSAYEALAEKLPLTMVDSEHFLLPFTDIPKHFKAQSTVRMEHFYRKMRRRFQVLMTANKPEGGRWNFDADNRNKLKAADLAAIPEPLCFSNDVSAILERLARHQVPSIGTAQTQLLWPVTRQQAKELLHYFCQHLLANFGRFQDAMTGQSPHRWSLYHSRLSFALNSKMLSPWQVITTAISHYRQQSDINLAQVEGFVRQILGWREYVRGIYWANMPDYHQQNALAASRPLPDYFWHGQTQMQCMASAIGQSLHYGYAHHIQRLMVTGNFCLLTGIHPDHVDAWYLGIYVDAIEWVELPNTRGMSQFADGGWIASKPYCASGSYIQRMSDYCQHCHYQVKDKTGPDACPFNSLYWRFMLHHRQRLAQNPRLGMLYGNWDKQSPAEQAAILQRADWCLENLDKL
ncbi:cryptochrome/photolyase family protein [Gallaecimonas mangrovi]|uniref:cryptochrome/photolyase family protein n=1 Tax=Gallaecimonas mangrovi TaxID=2291597 RepID=UPI000E1FCAB0|nr:cryptochrome/photolyase family protein [Gallaecimonas mangrovi]